MKWTNKIEVTNEDNMALMARYPDNHFDLAIVDPPYGIGFSNKVRDIKRKKWDNSIPDDEYFKELFRVSKNQIIWGGNYYPYLWNNGCRCFIFWNKDVNFDRYSAGELAFTSFNKPAKYFYYAWNGLADGIKGRNKKQKTIHPTQKPIQLYKWLLQNYAKENDKILDTHLGSGSIALACHELGFNLTACELDTEYYEAAYKRFKEQTSQLRLKL